MLGRVLAICVYNHLGCWSVEPASVTPSPHQVQDKPSGARNATDSDDHVATGAKAWGRVLTPLTNGSDSNAAATVASAGDTVSTRKGGDGGGAVIDLCSVEAQQRPEGGRKGESEELQPPGGKSSRKIEVEPAAAAAEEEEAAAARKERLMPTTRHFHAEVEVSGRKCRPVACAFRFGGGGGSPYESVV